MPEISSGDTAVCHHHSRKLVQRLRITGAPPPDYSSPPVKMAPALAQGVISLALSGMKIGFSKISQRHNKLA